MKMPGRPTAQSSAHDEAPHRAITRSAAASAEATSAMKAVTVT